jgi:hypothetical protein
MPGHATAEQDERIRILEERTRSGNAVCEELLELSLLALEPQHDPFHAAELLVLVDAKCGDPRAKLWLAFTRIYKLMDDEALRTAVGLCDELLQTEDVKLRAAAWMLRAAARRQLSLGEDVGDDIERSVQLAPEWIGNRLLFAQVLIERGDGKAAEEQLREALVNVHELPPAEDYQQYMFELLVTAQRSVGVADRLTRKLEDLRRRLGE